VRIPGVRIDVTTRGDVQSGQIGAAILWAVSRVNRDSLRIDARAFDERFGSTSAREAILGAADPRVVVDDLQRGVASFSRAARRFLIYP
jgi:hypothetical protein